MVALTLVTGSFAASELRNFRDGYSRGSTICLATINSPGIYGPSIRLL